MNKIMDGQKTESGRSWERRSLAWSAAVLCALLGMWGCMAIYSTQIAALRDWNFLGRQVVFLLIGLPVLAICWKIPFRWYERFGIPLALAALFGVFSVLFWGRPVNGMSGWFEPFSGIQVQPSELAKPFYLLLLALLWTRIARHSEFAAMAVCFVAAAAFVVPVALEPDYGSAVIFAAMLLIFLFISGCGIWKLLLGGALLGVVAAALAVLRRDLVSQRFEAVFGNADVLGNGWHVQQFQLAIARGGWMGSKLGNTVWTENYLPLAHNDSIFASMSETLGFLGTLPLLALLCALVVVLVKLARGCGDDTGKVFVGSAAFLIALQSLLHVGVNATLLPPTGLTLPLISYGGSSLIGTMMLVGMALSAAGTEKTE